MKPALPIVAGAVLAGICATVQYGSAALFGSAGATFSLPAHLHRESGEAVYRGLERVAPLPFIEQMLASAALRDNRPGEALTYARRMPPSPARSEIEAQVALSKGDSATAVHFYVAADDVDALAAEAAKLAARGETRGALALENRIRDRLKESGTHPDAVAESYWRSGILASQLGDERSAAMFYRQSHDLSPFSEKYLLAAGTSEMRRGEDQLAQGYFQNTLAINPESADAIAGLGILCLHAKDRACARRAFERSNSIDPASKMLQELARLLQ